MDCTNKMSKTILLGVDMAGLAHFGLGFAAKRLAPKVPLPVLLAVAWGADILSIIFLILGIESMASTSYWSHGLFMCVVWSLLTGVITAIISRSFRTSLVLGLLFLCHWLLDFIAWPMTVLFEDATGIPLLFEGSPAVGLGLYRSLPGLIIIDSGFIIGGVVIYVITLRKIRR